MAAAFLVSACNPARKVPKGRYLLVENHIIDKSTGIDKAEIESYIKQKPNRKILGLVRFHLGLYNMIDTTRNEIRKADRNLRYERVNTRRKNREERKNVRRKARSDQKNRKRRAKGLEPKPYIPYNAKYKSRDKQTWREWVMEIGEEPVVLDSMLTSKSARQIKLLLNSKGYFNSTVDDSVVVHEKLKHRIIRNIKETFGADIPVKRESRKAEVYYTIKAAPPYKIRKIDYQIEDELLSYYVVYTDTAARLIQPGQNYDVGLIQAERQRIATSLKNNGFYDFVREYIHFKVDSNLNSNQVDITIGIKKFAKPVTSDGDSIVEVPHQRYFINDIYIITDFNPSNPKAIPSDTTWYSSTGHVSSSTPLPGYNYIFLHNGRLQYKPYVIANELEMHRNELYQLSNAEATYKRLADLRAFKLVSIRFEPIPGTDRLNGFIQLTPILKQAYTLQTEGTNNSGNLGIAGSLVYQNKNTLRGAEILEVRLKGALEAQKLITGGEDDNNNLTFFNTIEFGPQISYNVPRPLTPFKWFDFKKLANPKTSLTATYNFQKRPEYTRSIINLSYSLNFKQEPEWKRLPGTVIRHSVFFPELSLVKVNKSPGFEQALASSNNLLLINQFTDHATPALRWVSVFDNQRLKSRKKHYYLRLTGEASGNVLWAARVLYDNIAGNPISDSYKVLNVPHSQYLRGEFDFRRYNQLTIHNSFVTRFALGMGIPYENLNVLPFERSFFSGGSNSIRAWRARSLGPGGFQSAFGETFDQIGDIQAEANFEFRFNVIKMINAAWFIDMGNIWLRKPDPKRIGGEFDLERIVKEGEIAIGAGAGVRVDFDFFIIRMDAGVKVRDPRFGVEGRWVILNLFNREWKQNYSDYYSEPNTPDHEKVKYPFINFNLGIGYPF